MIAPYQAHVGRHIVDPADIQAYCFHQLFEVQVQYTPDAIAVKDGEYTLTYDELNKRANQLAHYLHSIGVGSETLIGISQERSVSIVIGLLAILKAGATYIPLDPDFPTERITYMIENSHLEFLLTQESLLKQVAFGKIRHCICIDRDQHLLYQQPCHNPDIPVYAEQIAYILYTSGSTGQPKGVQISQQALLNFLCSMQQELGITAQDNILAITTFSFDIAGLELFMPLLVGASVFIADRNASINGQALIQALETTHTTFLQATPTTWRILINAGWLGKMDLTALSGGEALPLDLMEQLLPRVHTLYNVYGPTETTIWSTITRCTSNGETPTIGFPIWNTQVYVLDAAMQQVPPGSTGELYIGGIGLAHGYHKQSALTAERFVPHPYSAIPGERLYKTGDLGRLRTDGALDFLGRSDQQIKIRGYRIECGEIEVALSRHPAIQEAIVVPYEQADKSRLLVAFLIFSAQTTITPDKLQHSLLQTLPDYMVPVHFVSVKDFPQTLNGKTDRRALSTAPLNRYGYLLEDLYVMPRNELEELIVQAWMEVLYCRRVSIYDNFFARGGDSLRAAQIISRLQQMLQVSIPLQTLFDYPTVETLSNALEALLILQIAELSDEEAYNQLCYTALS